MPSDLRKRNPNLLPRTLNNPRPPSPDAPSHSSINRHKPTIAPSIFIVLILTLVVLLFPVFYYTQVMLPDPKSTSFLSHVKREGHKLLAGLGQVNSGGPGRPQFVLDPKAQQEAEQGKKMATEAVKNQDEDKSESNSIKQLRSLLSDDKFKSAIKNAKEAKEGTGSDKKNPMSIQERDRLDEQLGKFWQASSQYRADAQERQKGQYAMMGDGASAKSHTESSTRASSIEDLPEADPDAKEGLTPEVWAAISEQLTADQLTVMLDAVRSQEV